MLAYIVGLDPTMLLVVVGLPLGLLSYFLLPEDATRRRDD